MKLLCWLIGHKFNKNGVSIKLGSKTTETSITLHKCSRCGEVEANWHFIADNGKLKFKSPMESDDIEQDRTTPPSVIRAMSASLDKELGDEKTKPSRKKVQKSSNSNSK